MEKNRAGEFGLFLLKFFFVAGSGVAFWQVYSNIFLPQIDPTVANADFQRAIFDILRLVGVGITSTIALLLTLSFDNSSQKKQTQEMIIGASPEAERIFRVITNENHGAALLAMIEDLDKYANDARPVFSSILAARLDRISEDVKGIMNGRFEVSEAQETRVTKILIKDGNWRSNVKAVNYDEEDWWLSGEGYRYLSDHRVLTDMNVAIKRIFIISIKDVSFIGEVLDEHKKINAEAFVLTVDEVKKHEGRENDLLVDFVVYDDELVRFADPKSAERIGKFAIITNGKESVDQFLDRFARLEVILQKIGREAYELPTDLIPLTAEIQNDTTNLERGA